MSTQPIIEFRHVQKSFGNKLVLEDLNFAVYPGETFCILGASGSGKSVTLKLLLGLEPIDGGEIYYRGQKISDLSERELLPIRREFGMVFQGSALFDSLTLLENVAYPLTEVGGELDAAATPIALEKLGIVGLTEAVHLLPADISGGMRKRVGVARALATKPKVMLYDEPTAGLDPANVNRVDELILQLQRTFAVTSILVTHNMESVCRIADRVGLLHRYRLCFIGTREEFTKTTNLVVRRFVKGEVCEGE